MGSYFSTDTVYFSSPKITSELIYFPTMRSSYSSQSKLVWNASTRIVPTGMSVRGGKTYPVQNLGVETYYTPSVTITKSANVSHGLDYIKQYHITGDNGASIVTACFGGDANFYAGGKITLWRGLVLYMEKNGLVVYNIPLFCATGGAILAVALRWYDFYIVARLLTKKIFNVLFAI